MRTPRYLHAEAVNALHRLNENIDGKPSVENLLKLFPLLLDQRRKFVLYLGAGCSASVRLRGNRSWRAPLWNELLDGLVERLDGDVRRSLFTTLGDRAGIGRESGKTLTLADVRTHYDTLTLAWFIGDAFRNKDVRDRKIAELVEPPEGGTRESPLFEALLALPFTDIITTNYDSNLRHFLDRCVEKNHRHVQGPEEDAPAAGSSVHRYKLISNLGDLQESGSSTGDPRVVYLHGRVTGRGEIDPARHLVFDRFDYAKLYSDEPGLLDFAAVVLGNSHTIYIGYGLLDPSFDFIESLLQGRYGRNRPDSFAFVDSASSQEFGHFSDEHKLHLIKVKDPDERLADVFDDIMMVVRYLQEAEPRRLAGAMAGDDNTSQYMDEALTSYVQGDFEKSWRCGRGALASALFWSDESGLATTDLPPERARRLCQIRLRLALCHYKLRSTPGKEGSDHHQLMFENMQHARRILEQYAPEDATTASAVDWAPFRMSLNILESRGRYHKGQYTPAQELYKKVLESAALFLDDFKKFDPQGVAEALTILRAAECYYYAKCQRSRIDYQTLEIDCETLERDSRELVTHRANEAGDILETSKAVKNLLAQVRDWECAASPHESDELTYFTTSLATIYLIALWTAGRHSIGVVPEVLPSSEFRSDEHVEALRLGFACLENNGRADPLLTEDDEAGTRGRIARFPSPRWAALRKRYLARGIAFKWVINIARERKPPPGADLLVAYKLLHEAEHETIGPGLEEQQALNFLETARLNVVALFGERLLGAWRLPELTVAAAVHYLSEFFSRLSSLPPDVGNVKWLQLLGYRTASYLSLVAAPNTSLVGYFSNPRGDSEDLQDFLGQPLEDQHNAVLAQYDVFASIAGTPGKMEVRKQLYGLTFDAIQTELEELESIAPSA